MAVATKWHHFSSHAVHLSKALKVARRGPILRFAVGAVFALCIVSVFVSANTYYDLRWKVKESLNTEALVRIAEKYEKCMGKYERRKVAYQRKVEKGRYIDEIEKRYAYEAVENGRRLCRHQRNDAVEALREKLSTSKIPSAHLGTQSGLFVRPDHHRIS